MTIGFIGQGFIGKNYADDFENRGYTVVRYALEEPYAGNREAIKECDLVFVAVPTPSTPTGFDASIIEQVLPLVGEGKIAVLKSTLLPGTTKRFQEQFPDRTVLFSPEFLCEATAAHDAANPFSNIVGMPVKDATHEAAAALLHEQLPKAPFSMTCDSTEAEIIKYMHNVNGYFQIMLFNVLYDLAQAMEVSWDEIQKAAEADPMISNYYIRPVHKTGRGAGGHCFIKDFAAFKEHYVRTCPADATGIKMLDALEQKNLELLRVSGKDLDLVKGVYGA